LVSHWPVETTATVKLITGAFSRLEKYPTIGRAEALRGAMLEMIDNAKGSESAYEGHPLFWAPFSVVGEAAAGRYSSESLLPQPKKRGRHRGRCARGPLSAVKLEWSVVSSAQPSREAVPKLRLTPAIAISPVRTKRDIAIIDVSRGVGTTRDIIPRVIVADRREPNRAFRWR
jgi:hypothetical protein